MAEAYGLKKLEFGPDYVIPKPLDARIVEWEATAVAQAAMDTKTARKIIDPDEYRKSLGTRLRQSQKRIREFISSYNLNL